MRARRRVWWGILLVIVGCTNPNAPTRSASCTATVKDSVLVAVFGADTVPVMRLTVGCR